MTSFSWIDLEQSSLQFGLETWGGGDNIHCTQGMRVGCVMFGLHFVQIIWHMRVINNSVSSRPTNSGITKSRQIPLRKMVDRHHSHKERFRVVPSLETYGVYT